MAHTGRQDLDSADEAGNAQCAQDANEDKALALGAKEEDGPAERDYNQIEPVPRLDDEVAEPCGEQLQQ